MKDNYVINGWIFTKIKEDSTGTYYRVVDNNGRYATYSKLFNSVDEMKEFVKTDGGLR